jgi:hypothetical protein
VEAAEAAGIAASSHSSGRHAASIAACRRRVSRPQHAARRSQPRDRKAFTDAPIERRYFLAFGPAGRGWLKLSCFLFAASTAPALVTPFCF